MVLDVYCDGSAEWKSRLGGIGVFIIDENGKEYCFSKGYSDTTISRMEGIALLAALRFITKTEPITTNIWSDSEYIIKSFTEKRLAKWAMIEWQGVKNVDMWKAIISEINEHPLLTLNFNHIRGHQDNLSGAHVFGNAVADMAANYKTKQIYHSDKEL
jgi:ribonuclease HI